jgi:dipeptidyl aminopeptidase/acylaminoacyl peptidase
MTLASFRRRVVLAAILALAVSSVAGSHLYSAPGRPLTETDLFRFVWIADPQISPDGSEVAFVRVTVNLKEDSYDTAIWIVPTSGTEAPRPLTAGPRDTSPRWSPDGRRLALLRAAEKDGKRQPPQIDLLEMDGGEARPITDLPKGCASPAWAPDGRTIAFSSTTLPKDLENETRGQRPGARAQEAEAPSPESGGKLPPHQSDVRIITRAVYRANGGGYLDPERHSHIWTVSVPASPGETAAPKRITSGNFDEQGVAWARDGSRLYFTSKQTDVYDVR